jgi:hypothetical protein
MATNIRPNFGAFFGPGKLPELEAVILARVESYPSMIPILFNQEGMSTDITQTTTLSGLRNPTIKPENQPIQFQALQPGFNQTYTAINWATGYRISKEMVDDGKFNFIQRATESFAKGQFEVREIAAANTFTDGFTDVGPDGQPLFSANHVLENGGGQVGSNLPAAVAQLSVTSFRALRNLIQQTLNENGQVVHYMPKFLVVPQALQDTAAEILKSQYNPENANNTINTVYEYLQLLPGGYWQYLTSDTAFFMVCEKNEHSLMFLDRTPLEVDSDYDKKAQAYELLASSRWTNGYSSWRGVAGQPGA